MITKFQKYNESVDEEYPYKERVDLIDLGNRCIDPHDDYPDYRELEERLSRKVLDKLCKFSEDEEVLDSKGDFIEKKPGKKILGIVKIVNVETFFDIDCTIKFTMDDGNTYEVSPYEGVEVYLKEEPKKIIVDPTLDPYGEEEWEF